jgi:hypothetical protein
MLFLNTVLLGGLAAVAIPVIIHMIRSQAAKPLDWGAMRFLMDTVAMRRRTTEWEDLLLMMARCALLGLVALAIARPAVPPDSQVPWMFVLPATLLGIALAGGSFVLSSSKLRWLMRGIALVVLLLAAAMVLLAEQFNLKRFEATGRRDVALVIDASDSMRLKRGTTTIFEQAVEEAKQVVKEAPRGTAFSVVLGGPAPEARTATPLTDRADVIGVLDGLKVVGGTFRAHEALGIATLGLSEGLNPSKEIIVFTDSQRNGWQFDNPGAWDELAKAWNGMGSKPKLILRDFGVPTPFRNLALGDFSVSRTVVGTDREVTIRMKVTNTGDEAVTPGPVTLEIGGTVIGRKPVGLLVKDQSEMLEFRHKFERPGPVEILARIEVEDDMKEDDSIARVVAVRKALAVLLVEGNPTGEFFERGSGYSALALAPGALAGQDKQRYLMDVRVVLATELDESDLVGADVVVLADVDRLPEGLAQNLALKVSVGCGLLIIAGPHCESAFYNNWTGISGPVMPLALGEGMVSEAGIKLESSSFTHESLALFKGENDLSDALIRVWRKCGDAASGAATGASFSNGDAFLGAMNYGKGRVMLVSCPLDARAGNLPAKPAFVPLVHELVTWTAGGGLELNIAATWSPSINLGLGGHGLRGSYFTAKQLGKPVFERDDPAIDFNWGPGSPDRRIVRDGFSVEWIGSIVAPMSGTYAIIADVDDDLMVKIGAGGTMGRGKGKGEIGKVTFEAGEPQLIEAYYKEVNDNASVRLLWKPPGEPEQIIPTSALLLATGKEDHVLEVIDPLGQKRTATKRSGRGGGELRIAGPAVPGLYQVRAGAVGAAWLPGWAGGVLPLAVTRDEAESRYEIMNEVDLAMVKARVDLVQPRSVADIVGVLVGKGFGREIWRILAAAAILLFLLESVLARWVSKSRRTSENVHVEFGEKKVWEGGPR